MGRDGTHEPPSGATEGPTSGQDPEDERRREVVTPGEGAGPGRQQGEGDEVDPGVG